MTSSDTQGDQDKGLSLKMKRFCVLLSKFLLAIPAALCVLVIRIIRPFVVIRLGKIMIWRLGCTYQVDWYLSQCSRGMYGNGYFDIFYFVTHKGIICNQQLLKMWERTLRVFPFREFAAMVDRIQRLLPGYEPHIIPLITTYQLQKEFINNTNDDLECILTCKEPNICFTREEERLGAKALREMGIPEGNPFVCFHARDSAFLDSLHPEETWNYHDYRDSNIHHYVLSVEKLIEQGFYAVRMGAVVKEKLIIDHPAIIDYAANGTRTDFLDVYLSAKCKFFIGSDAGITTMPEFFRRPAVYVNWTLISRISPWVLNGLFIFKKFYLRQKNRFLTFAEAMDLEFGEVGTKEYLNQKGIELIENTPEEIMGAVNEMEQRLRGRWRTTQEDEELQQRFWALHGPNKIKAPDVRVGTAFLRQNQHLLN